MPFSNWFRRRQPRPPAKAGEQTVAPARPEEPYVLECRECGKVFEATSRRSPCPECDSEDIELLSS